MRKIARNAARRQRNPVLAMKSTAEILDPEVKALLDKVIIPILLKKLRQESSEEKVA
jgi:hypothetical protein